MKVTITISTDRISRDLNKSDELTSILCQIAESRPLESGIIYDCNTKAVGTLRVTNRTKAEKAILAEYKKKWADCED